MRTSPRGRSNTNERGSSHNRRARREWLLGPKAPFGGDGEKVPCHECGAMLTNKTMFVDRIIPGEQGGRYTRDNIRPHCASCSCRQGYRRMCELAEAKTLYTEQDRCKSCNAHFCDDHDPACPQLAEIPEGWR